MTEEPESIGSILEQRARDLGARIAGPTEGAAPSGEPPMCTPEWHQWHAQRQAEQTRQVNLDSLARECPRRFRHATFRSLDLSTNERDRLTEWAADPSGRNVLFAGTVGSGKTHAAIALAALMLSQRKGYSGVTFRTVVALLNDLRPGYEPKPADRWIGWGASVDEDEPAVDPWSLPPLEPRDPFENACRTDLLILDDLGVERGTEWVAEQVSEIIDARWRNELPTIATTNLTLGPEGTLKPMIGERAYDRLVGSDAVVIRLTGKSRRRD